MTCTCLKISLCIIFRSGKLAEAPELRPKGLGLGASKLVKSETKSGTAKDKDGNELVLKAGALAKIVAGANKGKYCEVGLFFLVVLFSITRKCLQVKGFGFLE